MTTRHWFNTVHARKGRPHWTWAATAILFLLIMWLSTASLQQTPIEEAEVQPLNRHATLYAKAPGFEQVQEIALTRCSMCHAREPVWPGIARAPKGILLETSAEIAGQARLIYLQAGVSHAMPPANLSQMERAERQLVVTWYRAARAGGG